MNLPENSHRRDFLKLGALAGIGLGLNAIPTADAKPDPRDLKHLAAAEMGTARPRPAGHKPVWDLTSQPIEKVRVAVIGLNRGSAHVKSIAPLPFAEVVAVCDILDDRAKAQAEVVFKQTGKRPAIYSGDENIWEKMVTRDDIDVVVIATPWEWHTPMAIKCMSLGKHAFMEVNCGLTVDECWDLVDASEKYQRHCPILENDCYGEAELFMVNLQRQGFFGDLKHGECGYIHDQRFSDQYGAQSYSFLDKPREWRRNYHTLLQGNIYPTHGLGTIAQCMGIGRGDAFKFAVSVSSPEFGLSQLRERTQPHRDRSQDQKFICGDVNTSIIKTQLGRTIVVQHDNTSPHPDTRRYLLSGSLATFAGSPNRLAIDADNTSPLLDPKEKRHSHEWTYEGEKLQKFMDAHRHPLDRNVRAFAKKYAGVGVAYPMNYRLLDCIRRGITPDLTVYDAASWSALLDISDRSVRDGSIPIAYPDFTRGGWQTLKPLPLDS
jgi:hypothetical protein